MNTHALQATAIVDRIVSGWKGAPPVTVVNETTDLPIPAPSDARGLWLRGHTFIVSGSQPLSAVGETLAHEAIGHHSVRATLGTHWVPFLRSIQHGLRSSDSQLKVFQQRVRSSYVDDNGVFNLSPLAESDEITAVIAENCFHSPSGRLKVDQPFRKIMRAAAGHISRETLYFKSPVDFDQVLGTLLAAEHRLRYGSLFFGLGHLLNGWYAAPMSNPLDRYTPPMSVQDSQSLLKAEADRRFGFDGFMLLLATLLLLFSVGAIVYGFLEIIGIL
jgi:hypothetical protein